MAEKMSLNDSPKFEITDSMDSCPHPIFNLSHGIIIINLSVTLTIIIDNYLGIFMTVKFLLLAFCQFYLL